MFSLESPQRGDSYEYADYTISQYKKENLPKLSQICIYGIFPGDLKTSSKRAISVRAIEVLLYMDADRDAEHLSRANGFPTFDCNRV